LVKEDEWAVKIVSKDRISDEWLASVFAKPVSWVHRAEVGDFYFMMRTRVMMGSLTVGWTPKTVSDDDIPAGQA
jgi:hypothetical protein